MRDADLSFAEAILTAYLQLGVANWLADFRWSPDQLRSRVTAFPCWPLLRSQSFQMGDVRALAAGEVPECYPLQVSLKDSGMRIRVEKKPRETFVQACRAQYRHASDVLRDFVRTFTGKQLQGQADLFAGPNRKQK